MIRVIYEDEAILVVEKPAGVQAQESKGFGRDMVSEIKKHLAKKGCKNPYVGVVHRLDQPVKGVMVYGKTQEATAALAKQMAAAGHMDKEYLALVCGKPDPQQGELVDNICFDSKTNCSRVILKPEELSRTEQNNCKRAVLTYTCVESRTGQQWLEYCQEEAESFIFCRELEALKKGGVLEPEAIYSLLSIQLKTGRHHQIRVQLSHLGCPLLGDCRYNPSMKVYRGKGALCLCAQTIGFTHPITKEKLCFSIKHV
jgi:23S rRNA pseudouridine1911/1915/1917 synthase